MSAYIPADKLIAEIERLLARANRRTDKEHLSHNSEMEKFGEDYWNGYGDLAYSLLGFITSLQNEQPTKGYDEAYLNECIAKARKTWKGVDVDKYMDEMRGREHEQPDNEDIDMVAQELYEHLYELKRRNNIPTNLYDKQEIINLWKAGVEYGRNHQK